MRFTLRSTLVIVFVSISMVATMVPASAVVTPTPVKVDPTVDEYYPAASATYLAWEEYASGHYKVYAQPRTGGARWKVNAARTSGCCASPLPGTDSIIYQQFTRSNSDLYLYNLATKTRKKLPAKVDSSAWEYWPAASTAYVAFMRITNTARVLLLYNRSSGKLTTIASIKPKCGSCLSPDWVGSTHLVYEQCSPKTSACKVYVWTKGGSTQVIPTPGGPPHSQYGGAMDESTGDIYYFRTTTWCGLFVEIRRTNIADLGTFTTIYELPEGIDGNMLSLAPNTITPSDTDLLFSQYDCIEDGSDIYQIASVNTI